MGYLKKHSSQNGLLFAHSMTVSRSWSLPPFFKLSCTGRRIEVLHRHLILRTVTGLSAPLESLKGRQPNQKFPITMEHSPHSHTLGIGAHPWPRQILS
jgi:hypothetical protein